MTTIAGPTPLEIERLSKRDGKRYELHHGQLVDKDVAMSTRAAPTPLDVALAGKRDERPYELHRGRLVEKKKGMRCNAVATQIAVTLRTVYPKAEAYLFVAQPTYCFSDPDRDAPAGRGVALDESYLRRAGRWRAKAGARSGRGGRVSDKIRTLKWINESTNTLTREFP